MIAEGSPIAEELKQFRVGHHLTQEQLALLLGVTRKTEASWEKGVPPRSKKRRRRVEEVLALDDEGVRNEMKTRGYSKAYSRAAGLGFAAAASGVNPAISMVMSLAWLFPDILDALSDRMGLPSALDGESVEKDLEEARALAVVATFLIRQRLDEMGVVHSVIASPESTDAGPTPDSVVSTPGRGVESWWLNFVPLGGESRDEPAVPDDVRACLLLSRYAACVPDDTRKTSIVTDDIGLFEAFESLRGRNSYRGNLSVLLVDQAERRLVAETYLAEYGDPLAEDPPLRIMGERQ